LSAVVLIGQLFMAHEDAMVVRNNVTALHSKGSHRIIRNFRRIIVCRNADGESDSVVGLLAFLRKLGVFLRRLSFSLNPVERTNYLSETDCWQRG
jgi:hypothetical protein